MSATIRPIFSGWSSDETACEGDPEVCDCAWHDNARRSYASRDCDGPDGPPKVRTLPQGLSEQARRISAALNELATTGSQICLILAAIDKGASLNIGPVGDAEGTISGAMYTNTGPRPRYETARARKVGDVIAQLAEKWGTP